MSSLETSVESLGDFFRLAVEQSMLTPAEANDLAIQSRQQQIDPDRLAMQSGLMSAREVDVVLTLLAPNDTIPGYEILELLGIGGMGVVFRARQTNLNREVALKTILISLMTDPVMASRFEQEAHTVGRLTHPHIVAAYDFGRHEGRLYFSMELIKGTDADLWIERVGPLDEWTAWGLARQVASGLAQAAKLDVVHRDIKPANMLLVDPPEGFSLPGDLPMVKIADFGLAYLSAEVEVNSRITALNVTVGSPHYIAPEQLGGRPVDIRADIYSLGASVYHMLNGSPPFDGMTLSQVVTMKMTSAPANIGELRPDLSAASVELIHDMMEREPDRRVSDYHVLLERIDALIPTASSLAPGLASRGESIILNEDSGVVPLGDTQEIKQTTAAPKATFESAESVTQPYLAAASARRQRGMRAIIAGLVMLVAAVVAIVWWQSAGPATPVRVAMETGFNRPLFDGQSIDGWRTLSGLWVVGADDEGSMVIMGEDGGIERSLTDPNDPNDAPEFFRIAMVARLHKAEQLEVHFGFDGVDQQHRTRSLLRITGDRFIIGRHREGQSELLMPTSVPRPANDPHDRIPLMIERQPAGWFITSRDVTLGSLAPTGGAERPVLQIHTSGGVAWISDVFIEQLMPTEKVKEKKVNET